MSRDLRALSETIRNLITISEALEYIRSKFKGNVNPYLLQSQEHLASSIDFLKQAEYITKSSESKQRNQQMIQQVEFEEAQEKLKKEQEEENRRQMILEQTRRKIEKVQKRGDK